MPDLGERVAALEAILAVQLGLSSPPDWTEGAVAEFRKRLAGAATEPPHVIPPLTPEQVRQLLSECVTVVKPGETLVIRGHNWTPNQVRDIQRAMDALREDGRIPFRALAVFGDELAVAEPEEAPGAA